MANFKSDRNLAFVGFQQNSRSHYVFLYFPHILRNLAIKMAFQGSTVEELYQLQMKYPSLTTIESRSFDPLRWRLKHSFSFLKDSPSLHSLTPLPQDSRQQLNRSRSRVSKKQNQILVQPQLHLTSTSCRSYHRIKHFTFQHPLARQPLQQQR